VAVLATTRLLDQESALLELVQALSEEKQQGRAIQ
jgi:hypothetical protein